MSLARSSLWFAAGTLLSRLTGLFRDRTLLSVFGAGEMMSGFIIAFRIPNMLREMLAEGALGSSFTKVYSSLDSQDPERAKRLLIDSLILVGLFSIFICAIGILAAPLVVRLMTSEAESGPSLVLTATGLTRILFPFLSFMSLGAIISGALHKKGSFFISSSSPVFFNIMNITGAVVFAPLLETYGGDWIARWIAPKAITGLAIGVLLGGLGQLIAQSYDLRQDLYLGYLNIKKTGFRNPWTPDVKHMLLLMAPMALAAGGGQIKTVVNNYFATTQGPGAVVWLDSAFRLLHLPVGLFGIAISAAVLPSLSRALASTDGVANQTASKEIQKAVEMVLWLMTPCFVFLLINHQDLVSCLYQSGRFGAEDSFQTSRALFAYSFATISYGLSRVMTSFYFAFERTKFAFFVSFGNISLNLLANWIMVDRFGHVGLAWGYSLSQGVSLVPLIWGMTGRGIQFERSKFLRCLSSLTLAAILGGLAMAFLRSEWFNPLVIQDGFSGFPLWLQKGFLLGCSSLVCCVIFAGGLLIYLKISPSHLFQIMRRRVFKKNRM
jgi:putative peptidoglycan lipid II flippase